MVTVQQWLVLEMFHCRCANGSYYVIRLPITHLNDTVCDIVCDIVCFNPTGA